MSGGIQILPSDPGPGAAIGAGLGEGLGDQLPKEMDRGRLAASLRGMQGQEASDPLEITARLIAGGADPSLAQQLVPVIQQQARAKQFMGPQGKAPQDRPPQGAPKTPQQSVDEQNPEAPTIYQTPDDVAQQEQRSGPPESERQDHKYYNRPLPQDVIVQRAQKDFQNRPAFFKNEPSLAIQYYKDEDERRVAADQAREQRMKNIREGLKNSMTEMVGGQPANAIIGDTVEKLIHKAQKEAVDEGKMSDKEAIDRFSSEALDFAKTRSRVRSGWGSFFAPWKGREAVRSLSDARKQYGRLGLLEELRDDIMHAGGLSRPYASYLAYPPSKELKSAFKDVPRLRTLGGIGTSKASREAAEKLASSMTDKDNPQSLALKMGEKGYDPNAFISRLKELYDEGEIKLTRAQQRDLERGKFNPGISDILYTSFGQVPDVMMPGAPSMTM